MLAACSAGGAGSNAGGSGSDWQAVETGDACALLPAEAVAETVGRPVERAEVRSAELGSERMATNSTCNYRFGAGKSIDFFARRSPAAENDDATMKQTRDAVASTGGGAVEDVAGLGKHAFWIERSRQLHVFIGEDRYIYFTAFRPPDGVDIKQAMINLARRVGA